ncbi:aspartate aminotransferase [Ochrobactrum sp. MYb15]|uniref:pyridoxal phosphate-dependent aminotransferase n=1 Tax=Brucella pituitosa TaxID=571256 RepID=UPI000CFCF251|nr:aspartate aminotransferase [Ochrobactrum sp. MYb19]PRA53122.1 aspartate aminotransferase [Ochrobactrum sp. MYb68]PRA63384.1 aspartate aminotransferase [Ochrobactrum sp. MYb18]PRA73261.1 aspartate aminotransferase [Brucella thiophenivorans]PRA88378.1 aspartate aminotransferase [Ochrobactrum sp. MYb14]PRA94784.1 aspartate aminotransferase [Ochrobactrum sp. MYb15]
MLQKQMFPTQARDAVRSLSSSQIREVANSAMGRKDVLPFWFGETDQPTAAFIRDAAIQSLSAGETFYAQNLGRPYLRNAIAEYMSELHGRAIEIDRISVVGSGVTGLGVVSQLMLSPGDRVVAITPLWPNITEIPRISGAHVERVPLNVSGGRWSLDLDRLLSALTPETKMLIVNSPNNPTGWTISDKQIEAITTHCRRLGIWVVADEVYERLIYDPSVRSAPSFLRHMNADERLISVNSFSKAWSMTGWRAGWITAPVTMADDLAKLIEYNFSCVFEPIQRAATVALQQGEAEIANLRARLARTRNRLVSGLLDIPGVDVPEAGGAMYVFFRIAGQSDSVETAKRLVSEAGLGLAPGSAFGPEGNGWLRWCHAVSDEARLMEGVSRLAKFVQRKS